MDHTVDQHDADAGQDALVSPGMIRRVCNMTSAVVHMVEPAIKVLGLYCCKPIHTRKRFL
jgi:hypothetical protein